MSSPEIVWLSDSWKHKTVKKAPDQIQGLFDSFMSKKGKPKNPKIPMLSSMTRKKSEERATTEKTKAVDKVDAKLPRMEKAGKVALEEGNMKNKNNGTTLSRFGFRRPVNTGAQLSKEDKINEYVNLLAEVKTHTNKPLGLPRQAASSRWAGNEVGGEIEFARDSPSWEGPPGSPQQRDIIVQQPLNSSTFHTTTTSDNNDIGWTTTNILNSSAGPDKTRRYSELSDYLEMDLDDLGFPPSPNQVRDYPGATNTSDQMKYSYSHTKPHMSPKIIPRSDNHNRNTGVTPSYQITPATSNSASPRMETLDNRMTTPPPLPPPPSQELLSHIRQRKYTQPHLVFHGDYENVYDSSWASSLDNLPQTHSTLPRIPREGCSDELAFEPESLYSNLPPVADMYATLPRKAKNKNRSTKPTKSEKTYSCDDVSSNMPSFQQESKSDYSLSDTELTITVSKDDFTPELGQDIFANEETLSSVSSVHATFDLESLLSRDDENDEDLISGDTSFSDSIPPEKNPVEETRAKQEADTRSLNDEHLSDKYGGFEVNRSTCSTPALLHHYSDVDEFSDHEISPPSILDKENISPNAGKTSTNVGEMVTSSKKAKEKTSPNDSSGDSDLECDIEPMQNLTRPLVYGYGRTTSQTINQERRRSQGSFPTEVIGMPLSGTRRENQSQTPVFTRARPPFNYLTHWDFWLSNRNKVGRGQAKTDTRPLLSRAHSITLCPAASTGFCYDPEVLLSQVRYPKSLEDATFSQYSSYVQSTISRRIDNVEECSSQTVGGSMSNDIPYGSHISLPLIPEDDMNAHFEYDSEPELMRKGASKKVQGSYAYPSSRTASAASLPQENKDTSAGGKPDWLELLTRSISTQSHVNLPQNTQTFVPWHHLLPDITPPRTPARFSQSNREGMSPCSSRDISPSSGIVSMTSDIDSFCGSIGSQFSRHGSRKDAPKEGHSRSEKQELSMRFPGMKVKEDFDRCKNSSVLGTTGSPTSVTLEKNKAQVKLAKTHGSRFHSPIRAVRSRLPKFQTMGLFQNKEAQRHQEESFSKKTQPSKTKDSNTLSVKDEKQPRGASFSSSSSSGSSSSKDSVATVIPSKSYGKGRSWLMKHFPVSNRI